MLLIYAQVQTQRAKSGNITVGATKGTSQQRGSFVFMTTARSGATGNGQRDCEKILTGNSIKTRGIG